MDLTYFFFGLSVVSTAYCSTPFPTLGVVVTTVCCGSAAATGAAGGVATSS